MFGPPSFFIVAPPLTGSTRWISERGIRLGRPQSPAHGKARARRRTPGGRSGAGSPRAAGYPPASAAHGDGPHQKALEMTCPRRRASAGGRRAGVAAGSGLGWERGAGPSSACRPPRRVCLCFRPRIEKRLSYRLAYFHPRWFNLSATGNCLNFSAKCC